ncbi:exonuclease domain-containing protein [Alphaproteobacteria bacterium]|nr:exonuclease domain-containing protein [Alphaproteobacteria bacterium]
MANSDAPPISQLPGMVLDRPVVVFDLEWTAWEGSRERNWSRPNEEREIIEIGAVKLDGADGLKEIVAFEILVRPARNPIVSNYFTELTGITQTLIDNEAMPFREAIALFEGFVGIDNAPILSFSHDEGVLRHNCLINDLPCPFADAQFHNVAPAIAGAAGREPDRFSTSDLPAIFAFPPPAEAHRALGDARCLAETLRLLCGGAKTMTAH